MEVEFKDCFVADIETLCWVFNVGDAIFSIVSEFDETDGNYYNSICVKHANAAGPWHTVYECTTDSLLEDQGEAEAFLKEHIEQDI